MLAGGLSRRLGGIAKGLELVGGQRIVDRVVHALRPVTSEIILAASDKKAHKWLDNVAVVFDNRHRLGGLAGIERAIALRGDILVVAWDMPFVTMALLALLLQERRRTECDVVVPESNSPYGIEPFCGFYGAAVLPALTAFLDAGGGPARDFLGSIGGVHRVPISRIRAVGNPERLFFSVNTPDDLARANEMVTAA